MALEVAAIAWCLVLGCVLLLRLAGLLTNRVVDVRQRRARERFTTEAYLIARQRMAAQRAAEGERAAAARADEDRMWREIVSWPELGQRQR